MSSTRNKQVLHYSAQDWKPAKFMLKGVKWLLEHAGAGLILDPGMRKTSIALAAFSYLQKEGVAERALVIAPRRPANITWPGEIEKWKDFNHLTYEFLHGPKKNELLKLNRDIFTINPEGLEWLLTKPKNITRKVEVDGRIMEVTDVDHVYDPTRFNQLEVDTLIVDESTKFKNTNSARFKYLEPFLGKFGRRWILTGTPAPNGLLDLFGQVYVMDLGASLGRYRSAYRRKYFTGTGFGNYKFTIDENAEPLIYKKIKPYVFRLEAKDYLELPDLVDNPIPVELPAAARKQYDQMEADLFAEIDNNVVSALSAGVGSMKCEQIASGAIYKDIEERKKGKGAHNVITVHSEKIEALEDFIEQRQGKPTLILYWFAHEAERIAKALGPGGVVMSDVTPKQERKVIQDWNDDKLLWALVQPGISHGLNLQGGSCDALFWYTLTWDLELYEQMWRRLVRSGSKHKKVMNHMCIARNTVDEIKVIALRNKGRTQKRFLDAVKTYRKGERV